MRLNFGYVVNQDFIFILLNFPLLRILQSQDIVNVQKCISFSILGFFKLGVKLGFEFPGVTPNQKYWPRSLNFDFDEERNPMPGSLKNSSSIKNPNFPYQKLKIPGIKLCFDKKMRPSIESYPSLLLLMDCGDRSFADGLWRETQKVRIPSFCSCTMSSSQVSSDTMLYFYH